MRWCSMSVRAMTRQTSAPWRLGPVRRLASALIVNPTAHGLFYSRKTFWSHDDVLIHYSLAYSINARRRRVRVV